MNALTMIILSLEVIFLLTTLPIFLVFVHVRKKQEKFLRALQNAPDIQLRHSVLLASYLVMTLVLCVGTSLYCFSKFL